eukprot:CAMPEP_0203666506 /NCGR_PEP_ID=MMETSP0090-20130426/3524_1 /ASSEMBLY_ACC=CAM_ASM_001088 /TAXON_ID=426623 /ORGANISM="Chaetoceros affinis, Strain CCMP159" /LENGTH=335 /DNA_ID=CAMNT_0050530401 /DNA_START=251 /DNA_END=1258 /DNA_ORIENTATION=+
MPASKILSMAVRPITTIYPKLWFNKIPEPARFVTSAGLGNIIFFYIDIIMYDLVVHPLSLHDFSKHATAASTNNAMNNMSKIGMKIFLFLLPPKSVLQKNKESISFFASYLIQILAQHFLNAFFVYGLETISTREEYMSSLFVTYSSYFVSLIGSTICNIMLLQKGMSKNVAFWGTVFGFGFFNYIALKFLIGNNSHNQQKEKDDDDDHDISTDNKREGVRGRRSIINSNNNNNGNNKNTKNNRSGGKNKIDNNNNNNNNKNNTRNRWRTNVSTKKMRGGGGQIYHDGQGQIMNHILNEIHSFVDGLVEKSSSYDHHHMTFVKSVGKGIELNQKI